MRFAPLLAMVAVWIACATTSAPAADLWRTPGSRDPDRAAIDRVIRAPMETEADLRGKIAKLACDVAADADVKAIASSLDRCLYEHSREFDRADDPLAVAALRAAIGGLLSGDFGIGAALVAPDGTIVLTAHNTQLSRNRTDMHGEMTLVTDFESTPELQKYRDGLLAVRGMRAFSTVEPCPMCYTRLVIARLPTLYCTPGFEDGMAHKSQHLPRLWRNWARDVPIVRADCSPRLALMGHVLFYAKLILEFSR